MYLNKLTLKGYCAVEILLEYYTFIKNVNILIAGHTHKPFAKKIEDKLIFNHGSVGQPRDGNSNASFAFFRCLRSRAYKR